MLNLNLNQKPHVVIDVMNTFTTLPIEVTVAPDPEVQRWVADLDPAVSWGDRKMAAQRLGNLRDRAALPGLLAALPSDPFWMVRCAIIQALEMIGDPDVVPTLRQVAKTDGFQVVRSHAAKAVARLSRV